MSTVPREYDGKNELASFQPLEYDNNRNEQIKQMKRIANENLVKEVANKYNFTPLKNDYLNCSTYYYDAKNHYIWEYSMTTDPPIVLKKPPYNELEHIAQLNNLPTNDKQPSSYVIKDGCLYEQAWVEYRCI